MDQKMIQYCFQTALVKSLNAKSTHLRELIITSPGIDITLLKKQTKV